MENVLSTLAGQDYCYLTTTGRVSGRPHEIEIWFVAGDSSIYLMAGNHRSDWVLNVGKDPHVTVRIAKQKFQGTVHVVDEPEEEMATRYRMAEKYQEWEDGRVLSEWARTALVVRIDLTPVEGQ